MSELPDYSAFNFKKHFLVSLARLDEKKLINIYHAMKMFDVHYCECPKHCGLLTALGSKFVNGHQGIGRHYSEMQRQNVSRATSMAMRCPKIYDKYIKALRIARSNPEARIRNSIAQLVAQNRPDVIKKKSMASKLTCNTPEAKRRNSNAQNHPETKLKRRQSIINHIIRCGGFGIGKYESDILNEVEAENNIKIERSYIIDGLWYVLDGYCISTNTAYEVDEKHHYNKLNGLLRDRDVKRQAEIEKYLKCKFVRIDANCWLLKHRKSEV